MPKKITQEQLKKLKNRLGAAVYTYGICSLYNPATGQIEKERFLPNAEFCGKLQSIEYDHKTKELKSISLKINKKIEKISLDIEPNETISNIVRKIYIKKELIILISDSA
jgi:hypothetical protein